MKLIEYIYIYIYIERERERERERVCVDNGKKSKRKVIWFKHYIFVVWREIIDGDLGEMKGVKMNGKIEVGEEAWLEKEEENEVENQIRFLN